MATGTALLLAFIPQALPPVFVPPENPITPEKTLLGKALFWEEQLSSTNTVACGTCHIPGAGGADPRSSLQPLDSTNPGPDGVFGTGDDKVGSRGVAWTLANGRYVFDPAFQLNEQVTRRKSPSMINAAFHAELFWDGRAPTTFRDPANGQIISQFDAALENQALGPILSSIEMAHSGRTWAEVTAKLASATPLRLAENLPTDLAQFIAGRTYPELFDLAFPGSAQTFGPVEIGQALATYQRTLISDQTPFDFFLAGDSSQLNLSAKRGRVVYENQGQCTLCHFGSFTSDFMYHNIGVRPPVEDSGRMEVTGSPFDFGLFKTPGLRNLSLRGRYFHDGSFTRIADVVEFYDRGGDFSENQSPNVIPLSLTQLEKDDLTEFLTSGLLDPRVANELPPFDRPNLFAESLTRTPKIYAFGTPGARGEEPHITALEPAFAGNPNFTLGLTHGAAFLPVFLAVDSARGPRGGTTLFGANIQLALSASLSITPAGSLSSDGYGGGWTSIVCRIPDDPAITGTSLFGQWFVLDPMATGGLASSAGLEVPIF